MLSSTNGSRMENNMNKKIQKELESSCEYVLPDYLGDVKKVLSSSAKAVPSGKFVADDALETSGIVQYDVIYLDSENKLSGASFSSDYDTTVDVDESYLDSYIRTSVSTYSIRLTGPRRISAKANVTLDGIISCNDDISVSGSAFDGTYSPKLRYEKIRIERMKSTDTLEREYAEEVMKLDGVNADEIEIVTNSAIVRITDAETIDGGVVVRGVISFVSIIRVNSEPPFAITRDIPFEETVEIEGAALGSWALADAYLSSVTSSVNDSDGGASVVANVIMDISAIELRNEECELTTDAYLCERDTDEEYDNFKYTEHLFSGKTELSSTIKIPISDCLGEGFSEFLIITAMFRAPEVDSSESDVKIKAEAQFSGIACEINSENESNLVPVKFSAPISFDVNKNCQIADGSALSVKLSPCLVDWNVDVDRLTLKCWTDARIWSSVDRSARRLVSSEVVGETEYKRSLSQIQVYYPEQGEDLYSVAKKFHTTVEAIASCNELSEAVSSLDTEIGISRLIIE